MRLFLLSLLLAACGDEAPRLDESPSPEGRACGSEDLRSGAISDLRVEVVEDGQAKATFVLTRDAEVGIVVSQHQADRLQFVGRVPFGPQRSTVVNEETFDLPMPEGRPLEPGEYEFTLRAFEAGRLNQGDPIDTRSACLTIE